MMKIISIHSKEFTKPIIDELDTGKRLVIWHQISASGGMQEWFIINNQKALDTVLSRGKVASAFTVYEWIQIATAQVVNSQWLEQVTIVLASETKNQMLLIRKDPINSNDFSHLVWIGKIKDVKEFYNQHTGFSVEIGRIPSVYSGEIVRGYYPGKNGLLKSGIY